MKRNLVKYAMPTFAFAAIAMPVFAQSASAQPLPPKASVVQTYNVNYDVRTTSELFNHGMQTEYKGQGTMTINNATGQVDFNLPNAANGTGTINTQNGVTGSIHFRYLDGNDQVKDGCQTGTATFNWNAANHSFNWDMVGDVFATGTVTPLQ